MEGIVGPGAVDFSKSHWGLSASQEGLRAVCGAGVVGSGAGAQGLQDCKVARPVVGVKVSGRPLSRGCTPPLLLLPPA